ncbi:SusD/RagB family nutrient-binding outer membrane lipoprotein [Bacteroides sp. 519]|uniref:SusD/RagB family nutrient-binding outer membrane lipoprotein n=1 Tax=Bacteroides sp. 519 TaxID=2302937 RepID=UPI0013D599DE|nr:SusD/RagB family nutrient-binding outer membrane lipoprotein [Bacteroides sp. 519]NDV57522.1 SusD/RagB family nutrient-binding outer membrane lipoprotein [Bacteroides sp. 519]
MKHIVKLLIVAVLGMNTSCDGNFDYINTNPETPTSSTSSMLALNLLLSTVELGEGKYFVYDNMFSKQIAWGEDAQAEQYNKFGRASFGGYVTLLNTRKMVDLASEKDKESYTGLAKFVKAYKLFYLSLNLGDIPYSDALNGEQGNLKPTYDTQKEVMRQVLNDLDEAYNHFSAGSTFEGDPIHKGNPAQWKKTVTAFQLKVLMHLSKKEADADLKVKEKFAQLVANRELMASNADNFQLVFANKANQVYPFNIASTKHWVYAMLSATIIDPMKATEDYRLFYLASPVPSKAEELGADSFDAYVGVDPSAPIDEIKNQYNTKQYCALNERYTHLPEGEPLIHLGYFEQNFILAEAALRGWIQGDATTYYNKAIAGSFDFIKTYTPNDVTYTHNRPITDAAVEAVLNHADVKLTGSFESDLEKIITQRYLASFFQHPYEVYYDYRRTGYPALPINPESNLNIPNDRIPVRWMYPQTEYDYNMENVSAAVQSQYEGKDDVNRVMWILK